MHDKTDKPIITKNIATLFDIWLKKVFARNIPKIPVHPNENQYMRGLIWNMT